MHGVGQVLGVRSLSLPGVSLGLALSLLLAVLSLLSAVVSPRKKTAALLWTMLGGLGCIAGFAVGDACVTTRCTLVQGFPGGGPHRVRVEVDVLGARLERRNRVRDHPPGRTFLGACRLSRARRVGVWSIGRRRSGGRGSGLGRWLGYREVAGPTIR